MGKIQSKKKGNRVELELAKIFEKRFGKGKFKRTPMSGAYTGGSNRELSENLSMEAKITLASDIITPINFRFTLESKGYESASFWDLFNKSSDIHQWFEQASNDASFVEKEPMIVVKYNRKKRIAYIREKNKQYIFEHDGWYCYQLKDLLDMPNEWWYEGE